MSTGDSSLLEQFAKQKGLATFDDEEEEEQQLFPQSQHEIVVHVEYCTALRPSRTGSLRGSSQKYIDHFSQLEDVFAPLRGDGELRVVANQKQHAAPAASRTAAATKRPSSAATHRTVDASLGVNTSAARLMATDSEGGDGGRLWPRIGAFEVSLTLRNTQSGRTHGPALIHSKLETGRWPLHAKVRGRFLGVLNEMLKADEIDFGLEKAYREKLESSGKAPG